MISVTISGVNCLLFLALVVSYYIVGGNAFSMDRGTFLKQTVATSSSIVSDMSMSTSSVAGLENERDELRSGVTYATYRSMNVPLDDFGIEVPVAIWYPTKMKENSSISFSPVKYEHQISVSRIGQLLVGWNLPSFLQRSYVLDPTIAEYVVSGSADSIDDSISESAPMIMLAHGYLGSRFDMSHIAEALAQDGFLCVSAEYPESLAASYERIDGLDRTIITNAVMDAVVKEMNIKSSKRGIVGHSLGCGTAASTGDSSWVRVCIAGFAAGGIIDGSTLSISSVNDGAVPLKFLRNRIPSDFQQLSDESPLVRPLEYSQSGDMTDRFPKKAAVLFQRPDAPNHISFLSNGVNNAMIDLLSPLLPVAQALKIPVLDFDKYKISQDSDETAKVVIPIVRRFLTENLM